MRLNYNWIFTLLFTLSIQLLFAQEKVVSGKVSDALGSLPGVNVNIKGNIRGTSTGFDGAYAIKTKVGETLVFTFLGMKDQFIIVGESNTIDVVMRESGVELTEVVVTGQGIRKEKKAVGYAVATLKAEEFASKPSTDVARALTGKVAGVNIQQTSGLSGSGTNIIIRGYSSITGNNQPLFVVDGIPFNSDTNSDGNFLEGNTAVSSRFLDLDPNSIEKIDVLKGLSATTLYGQAGRNGVILLTTKAGNTKNINKKSEISVTQSLFMNDIASLPEYQNNYGNGFDNEFRTTFSNWGPNFNTRGTNGIGLDGLVPHEYAYYGVDKFPDAFNSDGSPKLVPYSPKDNIRPFFKTGVISTTSISLSGRGDNTSYNLSVGNTEDQGIIDNNLYRRFNISSGSSTKLSNKFSFSSTANYVRTDRRTPPAGASFGSGTVNGTTSAFANILYTPRNIDLFGLPYELPATKGNASYRNDIANPRWVLANSMDTEEVRRFFGNINLSFDINSWSNLSYRLSLDNYNQKQVYNINKGGPDVPDGLLRTSMRENTVFDHTFSYNYDKNITDNWNIDGTIGLNPRLEKSSRFRLQSVGQFIYNVNEHNNFSTHVPANPFTVSENTIGAYMSSTLSFKKYLFFNLQGRNDWFSSLPSPNNSIFYPAASISFIVSDAIKSLSNNYVNYLKIRMAYGTSAGFPDAYSTNSGFQNNTNVFAGNVNSISPQTNGGSLFLGNPDLKPELIKEIEFGVEGKFFNNRLGLDVSIYNKTSESLIYFQTLDPATGYESRLSNIGEMYNRGIEIGWNLIPIKSKMNNFKWEMSGQFTKNVNKVIALALSGENFTIYEGFTNLGNAAVVGRPLGVIYGDANLRDINGNFVVGSDGNYLQGSKSQEIGDPNPDFTTTFINNFTYKSFSLGFQLEYRQGGDIYSATAASLLSRGLTKDTDFDRNQTFVLPGVLQNGNVNNVQIGATQYGFNNSGFFIPEQAIYDGTVLRLREVSFSYDVPKKFLDKTPFGNMSFSVVAQNYWFEAFNFPKYLNFDPEVLSLGVGNGQGFDFLTGPTAKKLGFNIKLTF